MLRGANATVSTAQDPSTARRPRHPTALRHPRGTAARRLGATYLTLLVSLTLATLSTGAAQATDHAWELRVCAAPDEMPFSNQAEEGFENRIADILADELGARLTYDWTAFTSDLINLHFAEGTCDVIMGVPDGFEKGLNTITYYQSPYVLVYRADAGFDIDDMDDPDLADLRLGVQGLGIPPHEALRQRRLIDRVARIYGGEEGKDRLGVVVRDVESGAIDVGFGWGPVMAYYAALSPVELVVKPVEPAFDFPSIFQYIPMTVAVRRNDVAMQERLNRAIVARWDDIQAVLREYLVPLMDMPAPFLGDFTLPPTTLRVGAVIPMPTGGRTFIAGVNDLVGNAARMGALQAEGVVNQSGAATDRDVRVLLASSPSAAAATRAADAMLALGEVDALVGGVGDGQAEALAELAAAHGVPFVNIGSPSLALRAECRPTTFHVQPSAGAYLDALVRLYRNGTAPQRWYVVYPEGGEGGALLARAALAAETVGDVVAGSRAVPPGRPVYFDLLDEAKSLGADTVAVLLDAADQVALIGQAEDGGYTLRMAPFPDPVTQTREFLASTNRYGAGRDVPRIQLWEPTLGSAAADMNERFAARWGQPFDAPAWAAYEAVAVLTAAARLANSADGAALAAALLEVDAGSLGGKAGDVAFRSSDHELRQPMYVVSVDRNAQWGTTLSQRLAAGRLVGTLPEGSLGAVELDALGGAGAPSCGF